MHPLLHINEYQKVERSIRKSWEQYIGSGSLNPELRNVVVNSWNRCRETALPAGLKAAPKRHSGHTLKALRTENGFLLSMATPIIRVLCQQFNTKGLTMVLTDNEGTILHEEASLETIREFDRLNFSAGAVWSEAYCGTNAIGTALETHTAVTIFSAEHYCEGWHHLVCTATPICDPFTLLPLGIVDLTGRKELLGAHNFGMVQAAKTMIEQSIEHDFYSRIPATPYLSLVEDKEPAIVFTTDGKITRSNRLAAVLFGVREGMSFRNKFGLPESSKLDRNVKVTLQYTEDDKDWEVLISPHLVDNCLLGGIAVFRPLKSSRSGGESERAAADSSRSVIAESAGMKTMLRQALQAAGFDFPVLITGRTGSGKERIAQYIYQQSARNRQPFVPVNCGSIPRELMASELFGYVPGAFTGADHKGKKGKFAQADKGVIFLDEIAELPLEMQPYLLRILEEKIVYPLGTDKGVPVDVRIIAATHKDLAEEVMAGRFREDLYYRLNVINLSLPDLKSRPEDILPLFRHFTGVHLNYPVLISVAAQELLLAYAWPGNVRELKNAAQYAVYMLNGDLEIKPAHLPEKILQYRKNEGRVWPAFDYAAALDKKEQKILIESVLAQTNGSVTKAARMLNISRMTLYRKLKA